MVLLGNWLYVNVCVCVCRFKIPMDAGDCEDGEDRDLLGEDIKITSDQV